MPRCFAEFTVRSFALLKTVRSGRANGLSMTGVDLTVSTEDVSFMPHMEV
jgi:hypothetical protein